MATTLEAAQGRWPQIMLALGVPAKLLNKLNQPCPFCGGKDRFRFTDHEGSGMCFCNQCGARNGVGFLQKFHDWDLQRTLQEVDRVVGNEFLPPPIPTHKGASMPDDVAKLFKTAKQIQPGDPALRTFAGVASVATYSRCVAFPDVSSKSDGQFHPCIFAMFRGRW
jgi:putative DNA primase/helicase